MTIATGVNLVKSGQIVIDKINKQQKERKI